MSSWASSMSWKTIKFKYAASARYLNYSYFIRYDSSVASSENSNNMRKGLTTSHFYRDCGQTYCWKIIFRIFPHGPPAFWSSLDTVAIFGAVPVCKTSSLSYMQVSPGKYRSWTALIISGSHALPLSCWTVLWSPLTLRRELHQLSSESGGTDKVRRYDGRSWRNDI